MQNSRKIVFSCVLDFTVINSCKRTNQIEGASTISS